MYYKRITRFRGLLTRARARFPILIAARRARARFYLGVIVNANFMRVCIHIYKAVWVDAFFLLFCIEIYICISGSLNFQRRRLYKKKFDMNFFESKLDLVYK